MAPLWMDGPPSALTLTDAATAADPVDQSPEMVGPPEVLKAITLSNVYGNPAPEPDLLAPRVARLMVALHGLTRYGVDGPARVSWTTLVNRSGADEAALRSASASGFLSYRTTRDPQGRPRVSVRMTPLGRSIFAADSCVVEITTHDVDLPEVPHPNLVAAVARDGSPAPLVEALGRRLGRDVDQLWGDLGACEAAGAVDRWPDHPDGPAVALTPWMADRLGLTLASDGSRWVRPGAYDPTDWAGLSQTSLISLDEDLGDGWTLAEAEPDPEALDPADAVTLAETATLGLVIRGRDLQDIDARQAQHDAHNRAARCACQARDRAERKRLDQETRRLPAAERKRLLAELTRRQEADRMRVMMDRMADPVPAPTVRPLPVARFLLGLRPTWPILVGEEQRRRPWTPADGPCPGCGGADPLGLLEVCLVCHRSGLDGHLPPVEPSMVPRVAQPGATARLGKKRGRPRKAEALKGGLGAA